MTKRASIQEKRLASLEAEFKPLLRSCLDECARGRWGLFGQNDHIDEGHGYWRWQEADRLKDLAMEIHAIRIEFGQPSSICERFLHLCSLRGPNVAGEPKLARDYLDELDSSQ